PPVCVAPVYYYYYAPPAPAEAPPPGQRAGVAVSRGPKGALWKRAAPGKPWQPIGEGEAIPADHLLLGAPGTPTHPGHGSVRLPLGGDLDGTSPFPIVEPAVVLHETPKTDLDFTLDRGRVDVVNRKKEGAAHVRVRVRDQTFDLVLHEPGTNVAFELYSRWPSGSRFKRKP